MTGVTQYNLPKAGGDPWIGDSWGFLGVWGGIYRREFGNCIKNDVTGKLFVLVAAPSSVLYGASPLV